MIAALAQGIAAADEPSLKRLSAPCKDAAAGFVGAQQKPAKKSKKDVVRSWGDTVLETLRRELPPHLYAQLHTAEGTAPRAAALVKVGGLLLQLLSFPLIHLSIT